MPQDDILLEAEEHMEKALNHLQHELKGLRTGRASPALVENLQVEYYGSPTPLKSIASISVPEATQLMIKPFEASILKNIEKAINDSKLGISPRSDGKALRLQLPPMSQERRIKMVGQAKEFGEAAKISLRNARRDANKLADTEEKAGTITEDEVKSAKLAIQDLLKAYETKVEQAVTSKSNEIMEV